MTTPSTPTSTGPDAVTKAEHLLERLVEMVYELRSAITSAERIGAGAAERKKARDAEAALIAALAAAPVETEQPTCIQVVEPSPINKAFWEGVVWAQGGLAALVPSDWLEPGAVVPVTHETVSTLLDALRATAAASPGGVPTGLTIPQELAQRVAVALDGGCIWSEGSEGHPRFARTRDDFHAALSAGAPSSLQGERK